MHATTVDQPAPSYNIAVVGSSLGGLSAAIALRRTGHKVTLYERYNFSGEVGASLSLTSNGSRFLQEWQVDISSAKPVVLQKLIRHEWSSGNVTAEYPLSGSAQTTTISTGSISIDILEMWPLPKREAGLRRS